MEVVQDKVATLSVGIKPFRHVWDDGTTLHVDAEIQVQLPPNSIKIVGIRKSDAATVILESSNLSATVLASEHLIFARVTTNSNRVTGIEHYLNPSPGGGQGSSGDGTIQGLIEGASPSTEDRDWNTSLLQDAINNQRYVRLPDGTYGLRVTDSTLYSLLFNGFSGVVEGYGAGVTALDFSHDGAHPTNGFNCFQFKGGANVLLRNLKIQHPVIDLTTTDNHFRGMYFLNDTANEQSYHVRLEGVEISGGSRGIDMSNGVSGGTSFIKRCATARSSFPRLSCSNSSTQITNPRSTSIAAIWSRLPPLRRGPTTRACRRITSMCGRLPGSGLPTLTSRIGRSMAASPSTAREARPARVDLVTSRNAPSIATLKGSRTAISKRAFSIRSRIAISRIVISRFLESRTLGSMVAPSGTRMTPTSR